jgi:hypothetical protein
MGQRFRLKASFDVCGYSQDVQVILRAMKRSGIVLADCGSSWYVSSVPVSGSDFEAVDTSSMMIDANSAAANQPPPWLLEHPVEPVDYVEHELLVVLGDLHSSAQRRPRTVRVRFEGGKLSELL